jgi:hypothetical protein
VQEIRGISLVFREMWDTTNLNRRLSVEQDLAVQIDLESEHY